MKKLLLAGVAGLMMVVAAGTQVASAAPWRPANHGHVYSRPIYHTAYNHTHYPTYNHHYFTQPYVYNRGWDYGYGGGYYGGCR